MSPGSPVLATAQIPPSLPGPAYSRVLQISSKLVHFQRSYIRTHEHRQSAIEKVESESNIRLKPSFEPNIDVQQLQVKQQHYYRMQTFHIIRHLEQTQINFCNCMSLETLAIITGFLNFFLYEVTCIVRAVNNLLSDGSLDELLYNS